MIKKQQTPYSLSDNDIKFMQNIQDFVSKSLSIGIVTVCEGKWITHHSNPTDFCIKYTRPSKIAYSRCERCNIEVEQAAKLKKEPVISNCWTGLTIFACPIFIKGQYIGCTLGGQVASELPNENKLKGFASEFNIPENKYLEAASNLKLFSNEKIVSMVGLIYLISNSVAALLQANSKLRKLGIEYDLSDNLVLEKWISSNLDIKKKSLTAREYQILKLIVDGKSNTQIANELCISAHTAKAHVSSIIEKFEVEDRVQVAVKAVREGII